jgi:hypothetical protein
MVQLLAGRSQGFKVPVCRLCVLQHLRPPSGFSAKKTHTQMQCASSARTPARIGKSSPNAGALRARIGGERCRLTRIDHQWTPTQRFDGTSASAP